VGHGGQADLRAAVGQHAAQPAGVLVHRDRADAGQEDRPGAVPVADADRWFAAFGVFVAQPKRWHRPGFLLEARKTDPATLPFARPRIRPGFQPLTQIDRGFFEHLLTHLRPPRQPGHPDRGDAAGVDGDDPAGGLGCLPRVERVDQIEPRPRRLHIRVDLAVGERVLDNPQALVEPEPGRPRVPGQHLVLLDRRVETEPERGVTGHH